jgi:hypothetical protein
MGVPAGVRRCAAESFSPAGTPVPLNFFFLVEGEAIQTDDLLDCFACGSQ